jgi:GNAT superfamily N-acetyltransferase
VATRVLTRDEIELIWTIDRSEVHHHIFKVVEGRLTLVPAYFEIPGWHPKVIEADTIALRDCFDRGGIFRGAFAGDALIGVSVVDTKLIESAPDHLQLLYLYVSRSLRGQGIGRSCSPRRRRQRGLSARKRSTFRRCRPRTPSTSTSISAHHSSLSPTPTCYMPSLTTCISPIRSIAPIWFRPEEADLGQCSGMPLRV